MSNSHCIRIFFAGQPKRSQSSTSQGQTSNSLASSSLFIIFYSHFRPLMSRGFDPCPFPVFSSWAWAWEAGGGAFTHPEQGSCSPLVNGRASLSSASPSPIPRHFISEPKFSLLGTRSLPVQNG